jgi:hypothetical protein
MDFFHFGIAFIDAFINVVAGVGTFNSASALN